MTIIVLLILAGISIQMLTGDNGILQRAGEAKKETIVGQEKEQVELAYISAAVKKLRDNVNKKDLQVELDILVGKNETEVSENDEDTLNVLFINTQNNYIVNNGKVSNFIKGISAKDIANSDDKTQYYGAFLKNYHANITGTDYNDGIYGNNQDEKWMIFYAGILGNNENNYIYLISGNYLHCDYVPETTNGKKASNFSSDKKYSLGFTDVLDEYSTGINMTPEEVKYINQDFFDYLGTRNSTYNNAMVASYLVDSNVWSVFKDQSGFADLAIGGPSLEMTLKSYNDKYKTEYLTKVESPAGYKISLDGGTTWTYPSGLGSGGIKPISSIFNTNDKTYLISTYGEGAGANGVTSAWICSPMYATYGSKTVYNQLPTLSKDQNGIYTQSADIAYTGIRPIVRLNKNVQLEKNEDGSFSIIEQ